MNKVHYTIVISLFCFSLSGCGGCSSDKSDTSYLEVSGYDEPVFEDYKEAANDGSIKVPYAEMAGNTITIPVKINGMGLDMIYDTGASSTMITLAEAQYLYDKGTLTKDDILDVVKFQTANGAIVEGLRINIKKIEIGDKIVLRNVEAAIIENQQAPLLLGQSVMKKFRETSVDRENKVVKFFE